jgi:hypothetical protein
MDILQIVFLVVTLGVLFSQARGIVKTWNLARDTREGIKETAAEAQALLQQLSRAKLSAPSQDRVLLLSYAQRQLRRLTDEVGNGHNWRFDLLAGGLLALLVAELFSATCMLLLASELLGAFLVNPEILRTMFGVQILGTLLLGPALKKILSWCEAFAFKQELTVQLAHARVRADPRVFTRANCAGTDRFGRTEQLRRRRRHDLGSSNG